MEDPGAAARLFKDFAKDNSEFEVKALSVSGKLLVQISSTYWLNCQHVSKHRIVDERYASACRQACSYDE